MARQPTLTINVNSQQFQNFARQFNTLSGQIQTLNRSFAQINASLNRTNLLMRGLQTAGNMTLGVFKSIGSEVWKITKRLVSWGTIIGGVTALLGMGGGLFGIERLAASILQKRRMVMGLGGNYGQIQAASIFNQSVMGSPGSVMQNVAMGMHGAQDQMKALMMMGVNPFTSKASTTDVMDQVVDKVYEIGKRAGPGKELLALQNIGADKIITDPMDLLRMTTEEGHKELLTQRELRKQYEKQLQITPRAQRAWAELEIQFQVAKAQIETVFGEKLADLAMPLRHLSEGFTKLVQTLLQSPEVQKVIQKLAKWIDSLAEKMKKLSSDDIDGFIKNIEEWLPTMDQFESAMKDFVEILQGAVNLLNFLKGYKEGGPLANASQAAGAGVVHDWLDKHLTDKAKDIIHFDSAKGRVPTSNPYKGGPLETILGPKAQPPAAPATAPQPSTSSPSAFRGFGLGGLGPGGWQNSIAGMAPSSSGNGAPAATAPAPSGPSPSWSGAANSMVPPTMGGGGNGFFGRLPSVMGSDPGLKPGPLSMNNWQSNRTASLVVRNVPGANIFMTAAGMTG